MIMRYPVMIRGLLSEKKESYYNVRFVLYIYIYIYDLYIYKLIIVYRTCKRRKMQNPDCSDV